MNEVLVLKSDAVVFPVIPASVQLAILLPTVRWTAMARSVIAALVGVANEDVAVLIADNSENADKRAFLQHICQLNPYIFVVAHEKNIGAFPNILYLFDWCKAVPFCAMMADDDWMSPNYYTEAMQVLRNAPNAMCAEVGTTFVDMAGNGDFNQISQASMQGHLAIERIKQWNGITQRVTMYNVSRRSALDYALWFYRHTPLNGYMLAEDLWELSRLARGDFIRQKGSACFVHFPANESRTGDSTERLYQLLHKDSGLQFPFIYFSALSTAIQCAIFLMGRYSPIVNVEQRRVCGQYVFKHIFADCFLPVFAQEHSRQLAAQLFAQHPKVMAGFLKFTQAPFSRQPDFAYDGYEIIDWFVEIVQVFETKPNGNDLPLSERFNQFVDEVMDQAW